MHVLGLLLPGLAALFSPHCFRSRIVGASVKPASQRCAIRQAGRLPREIIEYRLCHVLRQVRIPVYLPQRGRINQVKMPAHQLAESLLGGAFRVAAQQFAIGRHIQTIAPAQPENAQDIFLPIAPYPSTGKNSRKPGDAFRTPQHAHSLD